MKLISSLLLGLSFYLNILGQNFSVKELPLGVSYYGENGIHPGLKVSTFYTVWDKEKTKTYRGAKRTEKYGSKTKLKELNVDFNLGFYSHVNNHTGLFTNIGVTYLRSKTRKMRQLGVSFDIGYLRRSYKFNTYELIDGEIQNLGSAGNNALVLTLAPMIAREIKIKEKPVRLYSKAGVQLLQYNHGWLPNAVLELGVVVNINRAKEL